jgi:ribonuclease HI
VTVGETHWTLYTDGACSGNPGPGGYAAILVPPSSPLFPAEEQVITGSAAATTSNRMELTAVIEGLKTTPPDARVTVVSDSQYVVYTMTRHWKRNANQDLWAELDRLRITRRLSWQHVRGHAGHPYNERCDRLAVAEIARLRSRGRAME